MSIVDLALLICPREFREGYRREFRYTAPSEALNVAWVGIALRAESLARDAVFAVRSLAKSPLFTVIVLVTLALAISVNAAVFSIINAILLKPLPFVQPERLTFICGNPGSTYCGQMRNGEIGMLRRSAGSFEGIAAFQYQSFTLTGFGVPQSIDAGYVSDNYFAVQKIRPELGRFFAPADARPGIHNAVISHAMWQQVFKGNPGVVGRTLTLDSVAWHVIGVAPPGIATPIPYSDRPQIDYYNVWTPMPQASFNSMYGLNNWAVGRLKPGVSLTQASSEVASINAQAERRFPALLKGLELGVHRFTSWYYRGVRPLLYLTLAAVFAVLLIACANIASVLLARGIARQSEFAVRNALGAARRRILQQLIVEIAVLTLAGGVVGLFLGWLELRGATLLDAGSVIPGLDKAAIDVRVVFFTFAIAAFAAVVAGVLPAFAATRRAIATAMRAAGRNAAPSGTGVRSALGAAQIALAFAVIVACGLLYRSFVTITNVNTGINPHNVYVAVTDMYASRWDDPGKRQAFVERSLQRLGAIPGVESVAITRPSLWSGNGPELGEFRFPGRAYPGGVGPSAVITQITPGYLHSLGVPLLRGREIAGSDNAASTRVAVLDDHFAQAYLGGRNVVGTVLMLPEGARGAFVPVTVAGVVANITSVNGLDSPRIYIPNAQFPTRLPEFFIRMRVRDPQLSKDVSEAIASVDPQQSVQNFYSLEQHIASRGGPQRTSAELFGVLSMIALLLALVGIYGITAYSVEQRKHEIGVRMAIGAQARDVLRNVLAGGLRIAVTGIIVGIALAAIAAKMLTDLLYQTSPFDPLTFAGSIALLLLSVSVACLIPALRAASIDPAKALRYE